MKKHITLLVLGMILVLAVYLLPKKEELPIYTNDFKSINVQINGAIRKPGYYDLPDGSRMIDLINIAGGIKENADVDRINYLEIINRSSYQIPFLVENESVEIKQYNLNRITFQELILIPNITETRAINILLYREENHQFYSLDELLLVKGIGDATFEKIKMYFII